jgi:hypothetical protein
MIKAMEVSGIEGNFRTTCEAVLRVLRTHKDSLMVRALSLAVFITRTGPCCKLTVTCIPNRLSTHTYTHTWAYPLHSSPPALFAAHVHSFMFLPGLLCRLCWKPSCTTP